jgi:hypothetical protein
VLSCLLHDCVDVDTEELEALDSLPYGPVEVDRACSTLRFL